VRCGAVRCGAVRCGAVRCGSGRVPSAPALRVATAGLRAAPSSAAAASVLVFAPARPPDEVTGPAQPNLAPACAELDPRRRPGQWLQRRLLPGRPRDLGRADAVLAELVRRRHDQLDNPHRRDHCRHCVYWPATAPTTGASRPAAGLRSMSSSPAAPEMTGAGISSGPGSTPGSATPATSPSTSRSRRSARNKAAASRTTLRWRGPLGRQLRPRPHYIAGPYPNQTVQFIWLDIWRPRSGRDHSG